MSAGMGLSGMPMGVLALWFTVISPTSFTLNISVIFHLLARAFFKIIIALDILLIAPEDHCFHADGITRYKVFEFRSWHYTRWKKIVHMAP